MTPRKLLFVCTGNICRSVSAELYARRLYRELGWPERDVTSAGLWADPGRACPLDTVAALSRRGIDAGRHRARPLVPAFVAWADLVLAMTEEHRLAILDRFPAAAGKVHLFKAYAGLSGDVDDPFGAGPGAHDACAEDVSRAVDGIVRKIQEEKR